MLMGSSIYHTYLPGKPDNFTATRTGKRPARLAHVISISMFSLAGKIVVLWASLVVHNTILFAPVAIFSL